MITGISELNDYFEMNNGELIVVGSRAGAGKSTFVQNIVINAVLKKNISALLFDLESNKENVSNKLLSNVSEIKVKMLETDKSFGGENNEGYYLNIFDWDNVSDIENEIDLNKIYIDDTSGISVDMIREKSKDLIGCVDIRLIVIDYLQLISINNREENKDDPTEILRKLKCMAKELNIPVIVTSQLSNATSNGKNKTPYLTDFNISKYGALTYADKIYLLHGTSNKNEKDNSIITDIIVAKNNNGKFGTIKLSFLGEHERSKNYGTDK